MSSCGTVRIVPGSQGPAGANGTDGTDGVNSYTTISAQFTMPAELGSATIAVANSTWMTPSMIVYLQGCGYLQVTGVPTTTSVTLKNLEDAATGAYADNVAPGTLIAIGSKLTAGGKQGPAGTDGSSGAPTDATYITMQAEVGLSAEFSLGGGGMSTGLLYNTVAAGVGTPSTAIDGTHYLSPTTGLAKSGNLAGLADAAISRTNLGVAIGTNVQAYNALLAALAGLAPTVADRYVYTTGVNTVSVGTLTAFIRTLLDDSDAATARTTLGVLPGYGILSSITGWNLNSATTDTAMTMLSARYIIDKVTVDNASTNLTTATGGLFTAAGGGGTTIAADQALSALTASTKFDDLSLQAIAGTDVFTAGTLYARCGTAQGGAATANLRIWGWKLD